MSDQPENNQSSSHDENPLEDFAAEMSGALPDRPVEVSSSSVDRLEGGQVSMRQSAARRLNANALHMEESAAGTVRTGSVDATESGIGILVADEATVRSGSTGVIFARRLDAADVQVGFLVAQTVEGNVRPVLTPAIAAAIGGAFAVVFWALSRLFSRRR